MVPIEPSSDMVSHRQIKGRIEAWPADFIQMTGIDACTRDTKLTPASHGNLLMYSLLNLSSPIDLIQLEISKIRYHDGTVERILIPSWYEV